MAQEDALRRQVKRFLRRLDDAPERSLGVLDDLLQSAAVNHFTPIEYGHAFAGAGDVIDDVRGEDNDARAGQLREQQAKTNPLDRIEAGGRLGDLQYPIRYNQLQLGGSILYEWQWGPVLLASGGRLATLAMLRTFEATAPVDNQFFGGNVGVAGLMVGEDLERVLANQPHGHRYFLPDVCLNRGMFLDGLTPADLPRPVEVIETDGVALRKALLPS